MRPSLDILVDQCLAEGITVSWATIPNGCRGLYMLPTRTIYLHASLPDWMAVPTLMHEMEHARRGDEGPQPIAVETRIDMSVACRLVGVAEYMEAEALVGSSIGVLAMEFEVPTWVVEAFQRSLRRIVAHGASVVAAR